MNSRNTDERRKFSMKYAIAALIAFMLLQTFVLGPLLAPRTDIGYSEFKAALRAGDVKSVSISETQITGTRSDDSAFSTVRVEDPDLLAELVAQNVAIRGEVTSSGGLLTVLLGSVLPLVLMLGFWYWMMKRAQGGAGGAGGSIFSFGKSKARVIQGEQTGITFKDVGGAGEAVTDLREVTEFLKNPERFQLPTTFCDLYPCLQGYLALRVRGVPDSHVSVEQGMDVWDAAGVKVGHVHGLIVDSENRRASHIVVRLPQLLFDRDRIVPVDLVEEVHSGSVHLHITSSHIYALGAYQPATGEIEQKG